MRIVNSLIGRIFNLFRPPPRREVRYVPSTPTLPALWPDNEGGKREPNLAVLEGAPTDSLTQLCDDYWNSYLDDDFDQTLFRVSRVHQRALELLATRGSDSRLWARARLKHPEYYVRQDAAYLIMKIAQFGQLGPDAAAIGEELVFLALRVPVVDSKEAQAASVALSALSIIGGSACMKAIRGVLTSPDWDQDDNQWLATEILADITAESFMEADDPVSAAKTWLAANSGTKV